MKKNKIGKCTGKAIAIIAFSMLMSLTVLTGCNTDDSSSTAKPKQTTTQALKKDDSDKDASQKDSLKKDASQNITTKNNDTKNDTLNNDSLKKNDAAKTEAQTSSAEKDAVPEETTSAITKNN